MDIMSTAQVLNPPRQSAPSVVRFKSLEYSILESKPFVTIEVERVTQDPTVTRPAGSCRVKYSTEGGTATADEDYVSTEGVLVFREVKHAHRSAIT